jgi:chemotaxis protein MotB
MSTQKNASPVIIKRKKVVAGEGHHGGAWKVAYADFVTAMMAFFLLMWLLNATTEKQRKGIADYFNPNIPINRISGGGDAMFSGDSVFGKDTLANSGTGGLPPIANLDGESVAISKRRQEAAEEAAALGKVTDFLIGGGGESLVSENALKHVITRQTDEGLVIELFDTETRPLFVDRQDAPHRELIQLSQLVAEAVQLVRNDIAIEGHIATLPVVLAQDIGWPLSSDRADRVRRLLEKQGVAADRIARVSGHSDKEPTVGVPQAARNNRIEIILLREMN